jgi:N12 class adenine-specific DNA methylase
MEVSPLASGQKGKARDILAAIRTLKQLEQDHRPANPEERRTLARFGGFGAVALHLFPDPLTGKYKDESWQALGEDLRELLTPEEYDSAKRTTFTAFYTSPTVMRAMHAALTRLGVPRDATVLEPGCGIGNFMGEAPESMRFIGVELDSLSGRIARALHPAQDIRIENFRDTRLPEHRIDAVIGNVPFADVKLDFHGQRLSLHDFFLAKSLEALKPGGVIAVVTSHYTLDKQNPDLREQLAGQADFLGAIRLPADAFQREGTKVVTDILFLKKRGPGEAPCHADPAWLQTAPLPIEGVDIPINLYFQHHPEMVLGTYTRQDRLYGAETGYSVVAQGNLAEALQGAIERLPQGVYAATAHAPDMPQGSVTLPPLERHIAEGSFFVGDDKTIMQVQHGEAMPVTHGEKPLKADGTMIGRRLAALIGIRDQARRVLQSQNEGWSAPQRDEARKALNRAYDNFAAQYGPINKTTLSVKEDGTAIRRMPNLVKFRSDPDAMLVMSLEEYDEATGTAKKADIMRKDVVGRSPPVTAVRNAEEGLLVSLNHRGKVDLPYIASLYSGSPRQIIEELGDLIYQDPETGEWLTADAYLSGNVRAKLQAAERAGPAYARNTEALAKVQPEDVLPGDIDANLGAPWIPETDIRDFAAQLFGVASSSVQISHLKKDALWSVSGDLSVTSSVAAATDYGTERANGVWLLEQALNLKSPTIYDVIKNPDGSEERRINQDDTLAAREKQKLIKERFKAWIFVDPERTERLVRVYNDTYNNLRLRAFDGAHLSFPGMNTNITLYPHQKDAVWRVMCGGNTLLAHAVGAGKTNEMAAAGMKMKEAGLTKKPFYVVPNHMLEQFGREFMQLYPNARLLIAGKEDFTKERRKLLTAKIASGDWDGIIVTHSSFERLGMSRGYQEQFLREQIAEYEALLTDSALDKADRGQRNLIKTIEKQKAKREERMKDLLAEDKKDDGLVFDELGVDHIFIDESHYFKNLETPTKMERVAGIQTGGSERAFDLYMKCRYLDRQHPGHGVTFATGTPVSNTMVEMYTIQRYLDPHGLTERGIDHFDAWAATFGEVVDAMEISPDGKTLRPRSRFAKFTNLPELQQMFRSFADVKTAEMLDLPQPKLAGGKPAVIACPMSEAQRAIQEQLIERYEAVRSGKVKPWEDNALAITTDGRKLALDAQLLDAHATENPESKINALVENVAAIWQRTAPTRGTQLIFSDMGVNPTSWGYSVYQDIMDKLVKQGIPREQIASIGDADTDAKKQVLFDKVRAGTVRVLLGSTQKMGTGTNVQKRLVALHHLDAPWKPAEVEQRDGRILRQGNTNEEVAIYRYVTEGSFDAYMWQALETKARFIAQVMTGDSTVRQAEDIGGQELSYAEVKAIASGNPAVLTLAEADTELKRLAVLKRHHADEQYTARKSLKELPEKIARLERRIAALAQDRATAQAHAGDPLTVGGRPCARKEALEKLGERLKALPRAVTENRNFPLGIYRGLTFSLSLYAYHTPEICVEGAATRFGALARDAGPQAVLNAVERTVGGYAEELAKTQRDLEIAQGQRRDYETRLGGAFGHEAYLKELTGLRDSLEAALSSATEAFDTESIVADIKALKAVHTIEEAPERSPRKAASVEEAVTTRIMQRVAEAEPEAPKQPEAQPVQMALPAGPAALDRTADVVVFKLPVQRVKKPKATYHRIFVRNLRVSILEK